MAEWLGVTGKRENRNLNISTLLYRSEDRVGQSWLSRTETVIELYKELCMV